MLYPVEQPKYAFAVGRGMTEAVVGRRPVPFVGDVYAVAAIDDVFAHPVVDQQPVDEQAAADVSLVVDGGKNGPAGVG